MDNSVMDDRGPNPVDRHVGLRMRMRRKELGLSQERLAESVGLTFQQIQKYERAANRISASKLWELSRALKTDVGYFYDGLAELEQGDQAQQSLHDFLLAPDGLELAAQFPRIANARLRRKMLELVRALAEAGDEAFTEKAAPVALGGT
jgi:transcriptional regulator with XRE-family HTH domain